MAEPLDSELRLMRLTDDQIRSIIGQASKELGRTVIEMIPKSAKGSVSAKVRALQARVRQQMLRAMVRVGDFTEEGIARAVRQANVLINDREEEILKSLGLDPEVYLRQMMQEAEQSIGLLQAKKTNGISLKERVYRHGLVAAGEIDNIVNVELAKGTSAAEIAKRVRQYVNPDTPGGVRYAAQRLGRTEINNAFHQASKDRFDKSPFVDYVQWNLSGSHPKPDECNVFAEEQHVKGQNGGVYEAGSVPGRPHPNCLCFITAVDLDDDEMMKRIMADDDLGDQVAPSGDWTVGSGVQNMQEQTEKLNSYNDMNEWRRRVEKDGSPQSRAWVSYTGTEDEYEVTNNFLRNPNGYFRDTNQAANHLRTKVVPLDEMFDGPYGMKAAEDLMVARGVSAKSGGRLDRMFREGNTIVDPGYLSTSVSPNIAQRFLEDFSDEGDGKPYFMNIRIPKGSKFVYGNHLEREILLPRGTGMRIVRMAEDEDGVVQVFADLVPV